MEIKNCCLVKKPKIITIVKKNITKKFSPFVKIFILKKITSEKSKLVSGSGKTPVEAKTNIGVNATRLASTNGNVLFLTKIIWPIL